jgi:hypothetical protein
MAGSTGAHEENTGEPETDGGLFRNKKPQSAYGFGNSPTEISVRRAQDKSYQTLIICESIRTTINDNH